MIADVDVFRLFRRACPSCKRRGLRIQPDKAAAFARANGLRIRVRWFWWLCPQCGARYKGTLHGWKLDLQSVSDEEWNKHVDQVP